MSDSKININNIIENHLCSFRGKNKAFTKEDKNSFFLYPLITAIMLAIIKLPSYAVKENFSLCLSILIGLLLNLLVLILSNISSKSIKISPKSISSRLELLKETYYNTAFTIILCIITLILLFTSSLDVGMPNFILKTPLFGTFIEKFLIKIPIIYYGAIFINWVIGVLLYFGIILIFLHLFMILKRIDKIFSNDIINYKRD